MKLVGLRAHLVPGQSHLTAAKQEDVQKLLPFINLNDEEETFYANIFDKPVISTKKNIDHPIKVK